jgi:hypothetical protein
MSKLRKITCLTGFYVIWFCMRFMEMLGRYLSPLAQVCIKMMGKSLYNSLSLSLFFSLFLSLFLSLSLSLS